MNDAGQIEIAKRYIGLFMGEGDRKLCTPYGLKHKVEKYTDYFTEKHVYISENSAIAALGDIGFEIDKEGHVIGEWLYPSFDTIVETIGNRNFEKHFLNDYQIPFYRIPSIRVAAMISAYSTAFENKGKIDFPMIERYQYEQLQWIEVDGGALAYSMGDGEIVFDTIYAKAKRNGVGAKLFELFLDEVSTYPDEYVVELDAYTDDSKAFFESMKKRYDFFKPSKRLSKPDTYSIAISEIKTQKINSQGYQN